jgi:hypothetical protein
MRASCLLGISLLLLPAFVGESVAAPGPETQKPRIEMLLWYRQPGQRWLEGLPLGNGLMGAIIRNSLAPDLHNAGSNQSDCNIGYTAAVAEALLQSHAGEISLLPALPAGWTDGSITGLRARGGLEVSMQWKAGKLASAQLRGIASGPCVVRSGEKTVTVSLQAGRPLNLNADLVGEDDVRKQR